MDFREKIIDLLSKETKLPLEDIERMLSVPPDPKLGDYAFPCFKLGGNPRDAALQLQQKIKLPPFISRIEVAGPYLNFFLAKAFLAEETLSLIKNQKERYGLGKSKKNVVLEYCGPNTNKPLHLGHIRNMALGNAVHHLLRFQGNTIHPVNIVNDRGIHICQSMLAYQKWGKTKRPDKKGDHFVGDYYVLFAQAAKKEAEKNKEDLKKEVQEMLLKWELNDKKIRALWKKMNGWVLKGFAQTYKRFGISFEKEYFESNYYQHGKEIVYDGLRKSVFEKDHTEAISAPLEKYGLPNKVLLRGNETSLYITQDLYLAQLRYDDYKFDQLIYVVASEQQLHFKQLFAVLDLLHKPYAKNMLHLSYGMVHLPTGRMKSREGTVIDADDIMDEVSALAETEVRSRYPKLSEKEIKHRAEAIMLAAIKFFMVKTDAVRDIVFNPEESLNFEGETGPYLQYTHARACSVLKKAQQKRQQKIDYSQFQEQSELRLIALLSQFLSTVEDAAAHYRPHVICRYLLDLAQAFNEFYHSCQVISEEKKKMAARCALVDGVRQVLANGLSLLGIEALKEM
ncbi:arginine--tRNA ligase [Candidatus Woesearchaeota archaeon]|nr:arginine--tRNA ligase [Candidatus Woesearchaeota archaeon]